MCGSICIYVIVQLKFLVEEMKSVLILGRENEGEIFLLLNAAGKKICLCSTMPNLAVFFEGNRQYFHKEFMDI